MQHVYKTLFVVFLSVAYSISAQARDQGKIDSLLNVLKWAKEDTVKVKAQLMLSRQYHHAGDPEAEKNMLMRLCSWLKK